MRMTRFTHSCVRLESDGQTLVIDPGIWSEPSALDDVDAVLVTHEHKDHVDQLRVAGLNKSVHAPAGSALNSVANTEVQVGEVVEVAGFKVTAVGGKHAKVVEAQQPCVNLGYIIEDGLLYHPGDSLHVPDRPIEILLVPIQASWVRTSEVIEFVHRVAPRKAYGIHEAQLSERGLSAVNHWLTQECGPVYQWIPPRTSVEFGPPTE